MPETKQVGPLSQEEIDHTESSLYPRVQSTRVLRTRMEFRSHISE